MSPASRLGPFIEFSVAEFKKSEFEGVETDIGNTALHEWLTVGMRGAFRL